MYQRKDYINWDEYFMGIAFLSAKRSKDPNTQVGACIVSQDNKILSMGYNGFPNGCSDEDFPWNRESADPYDNKYFYTTHSELNAIESPHPERHPHRHLCRGPLREHFGDPRFQAHAPGGRRGILSLRAVGTPDRTGSVSRADGTGRRDGTHLKQLPAGKKDIEEDP